MIKLTEIIELVKADKKEYIQATKDCLDVARKELSYIIRSVPTKK